MPAMMRTYHLTPEQIAEMPHELWQACREDIDRMRG
jgi:hypothetical protein